MRKIKRWKQGIAVAGVIALTGSLFAGCGGADLPGGAGSVSRSVFVQGQAVHLSNLERAGARALFAQPCTALLVSAGCGQTE